MVDHAIAELPNEACGLLSGDAGAGTVRRYHPASNAEASPYGFEVDPGDLVRITFAIERAGDALVAVFHSHPRSPAKPSARDVRAAAYPVVHLIASLADPAAALDALRAWRIENGAAREVRLEIG